MSAASVGRLAAARRDRLARADDRGQEVVEVVGDAAGDPPDRLQLLALAKLIFEAAPRGRVARHGECCDDRARLVSQRRRRRVHPAASALEPDELELERSVLTRADALVERDERRAMLRGDQLEDSLPADIGEGVRLDHLESGSVHLEQRAVSGDELHALRLVVVHRAEELLAAAERFLGLDPFRDVEDDALPVEELPVRRRGSGGSRPGRGASGRPSSGPGRSRRTRCPSACSRRPRRARARGRRREAGPSR